MMKIQLSPVLRAALVKTGKLTEKAKAVKTMKAEPPRKDPRQYDLNTERVPVHSTPNILLWNRLLRYADNKNLYTAHALDQILEAGLNFLEGEPDVII